MKAFNGFKSEASNRKAKSLPAGAYVARIKAVKIDGAEPDQTLVIRLDVAEGEYIGYFLNRYNQEKETSKFEPRYRGDFKIRIPNDNSSSMYPDSDVRKFNDAIYRIEQSNPGYHWDWNENGLVDKYVGINMQDAEFNGNPYTKIGRLEIAQDVRKGIIRPMQPAKPRGDAVPAADPLHQAGYTRVEDEQLPWF